MHETIFHEGSPIRRLVSPRCMFFPFFEFVIHHFHAWSFTYAYTQYHYAFTFTFRFSFSLVSFANLGLDSASPNNIAQSWEGRLCLPLWKYAFLPSNCSWGLLCTILRDSGCWPRKLGNAVTEPATIASWDCTLRNSSSQQPDWTVHYVVLEVSQSIAQTVTCAVLAVSFPTSQLKLRNLHDQSHRYVAS